MEHIQVPDRKKFKLNTEISMLNSERWKNPTKIPVVVVEDHCEVRIRLECSHSVGNSVIQLPLTVLLQDISSTFRLIQPQSQ